MRFERDGGLSAGVTQRATSPQACAVRGSLIVASLESLREHNHYARYLKALDPAWCEPVLFCLASSWVPAELADAHYSALDAFNLSSDQLSEVCDAVSSRLGGGAHGLAAPQLSRTAAGRVSLASSASVWTYV
jgi:hypothetical protein